MRGKLLYYVLECVGSLACGYYGYYIFFLLRDRYGFGNAGNLGIAALQGLVWMVASWQGGRFAQRHGYRTALKAGLGGMILTLFAGAWLQSLVAQIIVLVLWTASSCFVWPALEASVSHNEPPSRLPKKLGIYNVVWGGSSALSYFFGGALFEHLGFLSMYWLPIIACIFQLVLLAVFSPVASTLREKIISPAQAHPPESSSARQPVSPKTFLYMAWLCNPFACMAINTLLACIPGLTHELHLSATVSGWFGSVWFFARLIAFVILWHWRGWHYRFGWLLAAFLGLLASFAVLLLSRNLCLLVLAQAVFGFSVGLIYYSSLFYSMDVGPTQGEHGGLHEAAMGIGNFLGPALGAGAMFLMPQSYNAAAYAVTGILTIGLIGLLRLRLTQTCRN